MQKIPKLPGDDTQRLATFKSLLGQLTPQAHPKFVGASRTCPSSTGEELCSLAQEFGSLPRTIQRDAFFALTDQVSALPADSSLRSICVAALFRGADALLEGKDASIGNDEVSNRFVSMIRSTSKDLQPIVLRRLLEGQSSHTYTALRPLMSEVAALQLPTASSRD